jgi:hypothetical protein
VVTANHSKLEQANDEFYFWAGRLLSYPEERKDVSDKIRKFYFGNVKSIASADLIQNYTNLMSDRQFFSPLHTFSRNYPTDTPMYLYFFAYQGDFCFSRILASTQKPYLPVIANVIIDMAARWVKSKVFNMDLGHPGVCKSEFMTEILE